MVPPIGSASIPPTMPVHLRRAYGLGERSPTPARAAALIAAVVPGRAAPDGVPVQPPARAAGDALPFYTHPADRNAAATAIQLGRTLDVNA